MVRTHWTFRPLGAAALFSAVCCATTEEECGRAGQMTCTSGAVWDIPNQTINCPDFCGPDETVTHGCYGPAHPPTCDLCGGVNEPPCPTGTSCTPGCGPGLTPNVNNLCANCGGDGQIICEDGDPACDAGVLQAGDHCYDPGCGDPGRILCPNDREARCSRWSGIAARGHRFNHASN